MEVFHYDTGFLLNGFRLTFHIGTQFLECLFPVKDGIMLNGLHNLEKTVIGGIVFQNIHDKAFFNGLFHGVFMERPMPYFSIRLRKWRAKHL